jgi:WD40 repeat protein
LSPDGKSLAAADDDAKVKVWDVTSGKQIRVLPFFIKHEPGVMRTKPEVFSMLAWSPDGMQLAVAGEDTTIKVWDVAAGKEVVALHGHEEPVFSVAWSPDGKRLASASTDGTFRLWDVATWQMVLTLSPPSVMDPFQRNLLGTSGGTLAWSPDGWRLGFFAETGAVILWDATPEEAQREQQDSAPKKQGSPTSWTWPAGV